MHLSFWGEGGDLLTSSQDYTGAARPPVGAEGIRVIQEEAMRLAGKVALITGGARGQGAAEARLFAREGAGVVIADVREEEGRQVEAEIAEAGGRAIFVTLDVSSDEDWQRAISATLQQFGRLDILVNNAAILRIEDIEETTEELWQRVMDVNTLGVLLGTQYAAVEMRKVGGGSIVNISSISAMTASPLAAAYHASKGAIRSFSKVAAVQYAGENIRVNSIHPGGIDTLMLTETYDEANRVEALKNIPMGRMGTSEEMAYCVLFFASDDSTYVTGAEFVIDGGILAH
jgi:cyclopentanol dehydrogenase